MGALRERLRWVRYDCAAGLTELVTVSPAAELAHRRLCDYHWQTGLWPAERQGLLTLCRLEPGEWESVKTELVELGWRAAHGRLSHPEVHRVRVEAATFLSQARHSGLKGARQRWAGASALTTPPRPGGPLQDGGMPEPMGTPLATPLGTPSATPLATPPDSPLASPPATPLATPMAINSNSKNSSKTKKLTVNAVNNEQLLRTGSLQEESGSGEKRFLADVLEAYALWNPEWASRELEEWGGWWRKRVRENADKARRVLAEIRSMIRERRVIADPGKAAYDLWNRLP